MVLCEMSFSILLKTYLCGLRFFTNYFNFRLIFSNFYFKSLLNQSIMKDLGLKFLFIFSLVSITSTSDAQFIKKLKQAAS